MAQRDISGLWEILQTNNFILPVKVGPVDQQSGSFNVDALEGQEITGNGSGNVDGDFVHFTIKWTNGTQGAYSGAFDSQGVINGSTFDVAHPTSIAGWKSSQSF
jgi:hypothetical protein